VANRGDERREVSWIVSTPAVVVTCMSLPPPPVDLTPREVAAFSET